MALATERTTSCHANFSFEVDGGIVDLDRRPVVLVVQIHPASRTIVHHDLEGDPRHARRKRQVEGVVLRGLDVLRHQIVSAATLPLQPFQELDDLGVLVGGAHDHLVVRLRRVAEEGRAACRLLPSFRGLRRCDGDFFGRLRGGGALGVAGAAAAQDEHQCQGSRDHERRVLTHEIPLLSVVL